MYYVYFIKSLKNDFVYIGVTGNLKQRFSQHNKGKNQSTKSYAPFFLVYYEAYKNKRDAIKRERKLKHHSSVIGHLKRRVKHSVIVPKGRGESKSGDMGEVVTRHV